MGTDRTRPKLPPRETRAQKEARRAEAKTIAIEMLETGTFRYLDIFEPAKLDRIDRWAKAEGIERRDAIRRIVAAGLATIPE